MACLVCKHTMQSVGTNNDGFRQFWCPRCGTIKTENGKDFDSWEPPRFTKLLIDARWSEITAELNDPASAMAIRTP